MITVFQKATKNREVVTIPVVQSTPMYDLPFESGVICHHPVRLLLALRQALEIHLDRARYILRGGPVFHRNFAGVS